jgi:hypothetical protein
VPHRTLATAVSSKHLAYKIAVLLPVLFLIYLFLFLFFVSKIYIFFPVLILDAAESCHLIADTTYLCRGAEVHENGGYKDQLIVVGHPPAVRQIQW